MKLPLNRDDILTRTVLVSETACVLPLGHPLANETEITPVQLRGLPLVMLGRGQQFRAQVDATFAQAGAMPRVQIETLTVASAWALAARGVGIVIVNEDLARGPCAWPDDLAAVLAEYRP